MGQATRSSLLGLAVSVGALSAFGCPQAIATPASTSTACLYSAIIAHQCVLGDGDKLVTSLGSFAGYTPTGTELLQFGQVSGSPDKYNLQLTFNSGGTSSSGSFQYAISITDPLNTYQSAAANITGSSGTSSTTIQSTDLSANATSSGGFGSFVSFNSGVSSAVFTQSWVTTGSVNSLGITIDQLTPREQVPGPLPILGAGAAFGLSRRMRKRINQSI